MGQVGEGHPIFAAFWRFGHKAMNPFRGRVVGPAAGNVLEIGAGGGENLPFYVQVDRLVLTEPDPYMLRRAEVRVRQQGRRAEVVPAAAERLPFPDGSFDTVVVTLALCTVTDQAAALAEVRRVLRPDGTFRFMEHVRSSQPLRARLQDIITPLHRTIGAGCHPNRDTIGAIRGAGFDVSGLEQPAPGWPVLWTGVARPMA